MSIKIWKDDEGRLIITCGDDILIIKRDDIPGQQAGEVVRVPVTPGRGVGMLVKLHGDEVSVERTEATDDAIGYADETGHVYLNTGVHWSGGLDVGALGEAVRNETGFTPEIVVDLGHALDLGNAVE